MVTILPSSDRGQTLTSWLNSLHSFSFGNYRNPGQMGFGPLRVINEDRIEPEGGFGLHRHENMEILTYILSGTLEHKDSLGTGSQIKRGDIQRMTAGTGIQHSEFNPSLTEKVHLLQIWIIPKVKDLTPGYEQKTIPIEHSPNQLIPIATPNGHGESVKINQNVILYCCLLEEHQTVIIPSGINDCWVQMISGEVNIKDGHHISQHLCAGDGAAVTGGEPIILKAVEASEFLLFEFLKT